MTDPTHLDLHRQMGALQSQMADTREDVAEIKKDVAALKEAAQMGKGAWWAMVKVGAALMALGAAIGWVLQYLRGH